MTILVTLLALMSCFYIVDVFPGISQDNHDWTPKTSATVRLLADHNSQWSVMLFRLLSQKLYALLNLLIVFLPDHNQTTVI